MHRLLGKNNPELKSIKKLSRRRHRDIEKKFLIEGIRFVEEALSSAWPLESFIYSPRLVEGERGQALLEMAVRKGVRIMVVESCVMSELADTDTPQGVLAVMRQPNYRLEDLIGSRQALVVVVDGVQDPGNLGTIIRSADAAAANCAILLKGTVDLYNPKTLRSTMGSLFHLPVVTDVEPDNVLNLLSEAGLQLVVGAPSAARTVGSLDLTRPTALVVGSEARGPSSEVIQRAAHLVRIPMPGRAESLNVATAASILLYEAVRQRID